MDDTTPWRKSSFSAGAGGCVQFRRNHDRIEVRDSKLGDGSPVLTYNRQEIEAMFAAVRAREFDDLLDGVI